MARSGAIWNESYFGIGAAAWSDDIKVCEIVSLDLNLDKDDQVDNDICSTWKNHLLGMKDVGFTITVNVKKDETSLAGNRGDLDHDSITEYFMADFFDCLDEHIEHVWILDKWGDGVYIPAVRTKSIKWSWANDERIKVVIEAVPSIELYGDPEPVLQFDRASCNEMMDV